MEETKKQIQELISQGRSEEALELLEQLSSDAVLLQSRYNGAKKQYGMGLIDFSEWSRTQAQINYAALEMMNSVKAPKGNTASSPNPPIQDAPSKPVAKPAKEKTAPKVFISYNQKDSFVMRAVKSHLEKNGIEIYVDINEIGIGDNIEEKILKGLKKCKYILSIISENSLKSGWVGLELQSTLVLKTFGKKWIPALLDKKCFEVTFYNQIMSEFDTRIKNIEKEAKTALNKGRGVEAFADDLKRERNLRDDFAEVVAAIKKNLGQDISGELFDYGMDKIVNTIKK